MMQNLIYYQYNLIKETRAVIFQYLESEVRMNVFVPVALFNNKSIRYMLVHVANTYISWITNFILKGDKNYIAEGDISSIDQLEEIFREVDLFMNRFCSSFDEAPVQPVKGYKWVDKYIETDSYAIFTHVITHEFHH